MYFDRLAYLDQDQLSALIIRRMRGFLLLITLCAMAAITAAAATATTTTLTTSKKTVNAHPIIAMTAKVSPTAVTQGLVRFYDGSALLGAAQIVNSGTKYTMGTANLSAELAPGTHSLKAVFAGTGVYASSASAVASVVVSGGITSSSISSTGSVGNYSLTGTVTARGLLAPTGQVEFLNQTAGNASLGKATLGAPTANRKFATSVPYEIYDKVNFDSPQDVVTVDLNGDGVLDLAVLDYSDGLSIHLGKGDGTFQAAAPYCTKGTPPKACLIGSQPVSVGTGDFNSDGIPDLVVGWGSHVSVAIGKGDGTFFEAVPYDTYTGGGEVRVADLNGDGTPDLVASISRGVSVLLGNGDGTFQPHNETGLNNPSTYISVGDFNRDGIPDVASAGWNGGYLMVLIGNGDGTFKPEVDTKIDINTAGCHVMAVDLKGTGYPADVAICGGGGVVEALVGKGDGTFNTPQKMPVNGTFTEKVSGLGSADINGDGQTDLMLTWYATDTDTGRVAVFTNKNDGTGTFNATPTSYYIGHHPIAVATGDLDGDGTKDIVVPNEVDSTTSVLLNAASQTASAVLNNVNVPGTGTQNVFGKYLGDANYGASSSSTIPVQGNGGTASITITTLSPSSVVAGSPAFTLTVNGTGFASGAAVNWNGSARTTTYVNTTQLTAAIAATDVAVAGVYPIAVKMGTLTSNAVNFTVNPATGAAPTITYISPSMAYLNAASFTMTVNGTNFVSGSIVYFGSAQLATTYVSATRLTASVPAAKLTSLGTVQVQVGNPGGVMSNATPFTIAPYTRLPLAYGYFNKDGTRGSNSGNINCTWATNQYQCTITGESVTATRYIVNATVADTSAPYFIGVSFASGKVVVKIFNAAGTLIQQPFSLVVFKP